MLHVHPNLVLFFLTIYSRKKYPKHICPQNLILMDLKLELNKYLLFFLIKQIVVF